MKLTEIVAKMASARQVLSDAAFRQAGGLIKEHKDEVREQIQMRTAPQIAAIISKLHADEDITAQDIALIRVWIVGDAESYLNVENDFENWLAEHDRLREILARFTEKSEVEFAELLEIQGVLEDAARVSLEIANYLEMRERVMHFDQIVREPERINKAILATILTRKLENDHA